MERRNPYLDLLRLSDLRLLTAATGGAEISGDLHHHPETVESLLERREVFESLFNSADRDPLLVASPFLVFSALVGRVFADLGSSTSVQEWLGPGRWLPVFAASDLHDFLVPRRRRAFLAALLASYTKVASGTTWERTARGWRRRRYSDLDPVQLGHLLQSAGPAQRGQVARRMGDLSLFLAGVFPEHVAAHPLQPRDVDFLRRLLGGGGPEEVMRATGPDKGLWLLEWLGRRAYRVGAEWSREAEAADVLDVAESFGRARRVLNLVTGRYLYPSRDRWFPSGRS